MINLWFELPRKIKYIIKMRVKKIIKRIVLYFFIFDKKKNIKDRFIEKKKKNFLY